MNYYQSYYLKSEQRYVLRFGGTLSKLDAQSEINQLNKNISNKTVDQESPFDFSSSGLGIGGINNDQSLPIIPSAEALERQKRKIATATTCKRCHTSSLDGAMFTTGGGNICDDCF